MNHTKTWPWSIVLVLAIASAFVAAISAEDNAEEGDGPKVIITSIQGDDLAGIIDAERLRQEILEIACRGDEVFRGGLMDWVTQALDSGAVPRRISLRGQVAVPQRDIAATYTYDFENHLTLHIRKFQIVVLRIDSEEEQ